MPSTVEPEGIVILDDVGAPKYIVGYVNDYVLEILIDF